MKLHEVAGYTEQLDKFAEQRAEHDRMEQAEEDKYSWNSPIPMWSKADDIIDDLEGFEGDLYDKYVKNHPDEDTDDYMDALSKAFDEYGVKTKIPTKIIVGFEKKLSRDHVESLARGDDVKTSSDIPDVYVIDGAYVVHDGHHRIAANILKGEAQSLVRLTRV
jgi:hypothetical protein